LSRFSTTPTASARAPCATAASWKFLNPQRNQIQVDGPEGSSRWVVVELNDRLYRKVDIDTGVEFLQLPQGQ
jgi:hypothetical protein